MEDTHSYHMMDLFNFNNTHQSIKQNISYSLTKISYFNMYNETCHVYLNATAQNDHNGTKYFKLEIYDSANG
jgi:hypothetical protein